MYQNNVLGILYSIETLSKNFGALCVEIANIERLYEEGQLRGYIVDIIFTDMGLNALELSFYVEQD